MTTDSCIVNSIYCIFSTFICIWYIYTIYSIFINSKYYYKVDNIIFYVSRNNLKKKNNFLFNKILIELLQYTILKGAVAIRMNKT